MTKNEIAILHISRRLTPEHRAELLDQARIACREEAARRGPGERKAPVPERGIISSRSGIKG